MAFLQQGPFRIGAGKEDILDSVRHAICAIVPKRFLLSVACLLISLWTGRKPTLRTYEMICFYFSNLASEAELLAHLTKLKPHDGAPTKL
jgi:hypothetical protein